MGCWGRCACWVVGEVGCLVGNLTTLTFVILFSRYTNGASGRASAAPTRIGTRLSKVGVTCIRVSSLLTGCGFYVSLGRTVIGGDRGIHVALGRGTATLGGRGRSFRGGCRGNTFLSRSETRRRCGHLTGVRRSLRRLDGGLRGNLVRRGGGGDLLFHSSVGTFLGRCGGARKCDLVFDGANFSGLLCTSDTFGVAGRVMSKLGTECSPTTGGWLFLTFLLWGEFRYLC